MTGSKEYSFWQIIKKSLGNRGCYCVALENIALIQGGSVSDAQGPTKPPTLLRNSARGAVARGSEGGSAAELQSRLIWAARTRILVVGVGGQGKRIITAGEARSRVQERLCCLISASWVRPCHGARAAVAAAGWKGVQCA